jgi:hypothetical protein
MARHRGKFVSYSASPLGGRGESGLGFEAQRQGEDVLDGPNWQLMEEHVEVESGTKSGRRSAPR